VKREKPGWINSQVFKPYPFADAHKGMDKLYKYGREKTKKNR